MKGEIRREGGDGKRKELLEEKRVKEGDNVKRKMCWEDEWRLGREEVEASRLPFVYFQDQSSVRDSPTREPVTTLCLKAHIR